MRSLAVLTAISAVALASCSGGGGSTAATVVPSAHGQEVTPPTIIFADKPCPTPGQGCVEAEDPGYFLQLRIGPAAGKGSIITYKLPYDFKLKRLDSWVGTGLGSRMETGGWFQYQKPDGHKAQFLLEFDKHQDVNGEKQREWVFATPIALPAGTIITVYNGTPYEPPDLNPADCVTSGVCAYDVRFFMYSE